MMGRREAPDEEGRETNARAQEQREANDVETLLAAFAEESRKSRRRRRIVGTVLAVLNGTVLVVVLAINIVLALMPGHRPLVDPWLIGIACLFVFGGTVAMSGPHKDAVKRLARLDDVRAIGPLVEALEMRDSAMRKRAEDALIRLLPRLRSADAELLGDAQRRILGRALVKHRNTELAVAILMAFEQIGSAHDLPVVEKVVSGPADSMRERRIREAARECLLYLQERARRESMSQTLLRPAGPIVAPVQAGGEADTRPTLPPDDLDAPAADTR